MALYIIGGVRLELHPLNVSDVDHDREADYAKHAVVGGRKPYENVGIGEEKLRLQGKIFPRAIGGRTEFALLVGLQEDGQAVLVTRGNEKLGWYRIARLNERHKHLSEDGVGRVVDVRIEIERDERPVGSNGAGSLLTRLFGYV